VFRCTFFEEEVDKGFGIIIVN